MATSPFNHVSGNVEVEDRSKCFKLGTLVFGTRVVMGRLALDEQRAVETEGPINTMLSAAKELGWTMSDRVKFVGQKGEFVALTQDSPATLGKLIHMGPGHQ